MSCNEGIEFRFATYAQIPNSAKPDPPKVIGRVANTVDAEVAITESNKLMGGIPLPTAFTKTINEIPCNTNATNVIAIPIANVLIMAGEEKVKFSLLIWHKSAIALFVDVTRLRPRSPLRIFSITLPTKLGSLRFLFAEKNINKNQKVKVGIESNMTIVPIR